MKKCIRFDNIRKGLAPPRLPIILTCLAIILTLPALNTGLQLDDYIHRGIILGLPGWPPSSRGLFCFFDGNPERTTQMDVSLKRDLMKDEKIFLTDVNYDPQRSDYKCSFEAVGYSDQGKS